MQSDVMGSFDNFVQKVSAGQRRPQQKFVYHMLYGIISGGSVLLSDIGRALNEPTKLIHTEKRLSRNLGSENFDENRFRDAYLEHVSSRLTKDHVIAVDLSDIAKPYSVAQEGLCQVWDGSQQKIHDRGWFTINIEAVPTNRQQIPLVFRPFSILDSSYRSHNVEIRKDMNVTRTYVPSGALWVADRGFDSEKLFKMFDEMEVDWAIRVRKIRDVADQDGEVCNIMRFSKNLDLPYSGSLPSIRKRKTKMYRVRYGYAEVRLPERPDRRYTLVVGWFENPETGRRRKKPIMILTNREIRSGAEAWIIIEGYTRRWGVEEGIRLVKDQFELENIRVVSLRSIRRLTMMAAMAYGFLGILAMNGRRWTGRFVDQLTKNFCALPRNVFYRLLGAVANLFASTGVPMMWASPGTVQLK